MEGIFHLRGSDPAALPLDEEAEIREVLAGNDGRSVGVRLAGPGGMLTGKVWRVRSVLRSTDDGHVELVVEDGILTAKRIPVERDDLVLIIKTNEALPAIHRMVLASQSGAENRIPGLGDVLG